MGWEIEMMLPQYIDDLMDPLKGGRSGLQVFKGLNYALNDAAKAPTMGATFSANFGHRSFGYLTAREAIDVGGFVQIKSGEGAGSLAKWLDPSQAYPREMVRQMANLQKFLDYDTRFTNPTIQKNRDRNRQNHILHEIIPHHLAPRAPRRISRRRRTHEPPRRSSQPLQVLPSHENHARQRTIPQRHHIRARQRRRIW